MLHVKRLIFYVILIGGCILLTTASVIQQEQQEPTIENKEDIPVQTEPNKQPEEEGTLPDTLLQKWDEGDDVTNLQKVLKALSYDIEASGIFDERTTWALTDIQLQSKEIIPTGLYDEETKQFLQSAVNEEVEITPEDGLIMPSEGYLSSLDSDTVENPYDVLALINKEHALPGNYVPEDLVFPNVRYPFTEELPKKQLRKIAADALEDLFKASDEAGLELYAQSGYRSYDRQVAIFTANAEQHGEKAANNFSARPGQSEHQSGLTMDVTSGEVDFNLVIEFGDTPEGQWIAEHAHEYGFIIRYLEGRENITQYQYEPWHLRYVGEKVATEIYEKDITFEEYIEQK
ncbi:MAG TPA: D-alanyl-D-alanine carboxypeptidase family protein [Bacillota bacterium]|nr:D-alanyl-D-alanine carboxypeptidase family protein [Bacillota bacterium]